MIDLVLAFGGAMPTGALQQRLDELETFTATNWDYRAGKERNAASSVALTPLQSTQVAHSTHALGLDGDSSPSSSSYDHLLILGGLVRACVLRPARAAELIEAGLSVLDIAALGGFRTLAGDEIGLARDAGLSAPATEIDAMDEGLRRAFGLGRPSEEVGGANLDDLHRSYLVRRYHQGERELSVIAAPSTEPATRRANTADTYEYWATNVAHLEEGERVLLVTSAIYVPFQHTEAIRMLGLPHRVEVETIGIDTTSTKLGPLRQDYAPTQYLQEVRSAIRAMQQLTRQLVA